MIKRIVGRIRRYISVTDQCATQPPSIGNGTPVIVDTPSELKKTPPQPQFLLAPRISALAGCVVSAGHDLKAAEHIN